MTFGRLPDGRSPFMDERVRQAFSMSWDRDLYIDAVLQRLEVRGGGLPVETRWNSALPADFEGWWLDPKGKDFGPNAKYFQHDIAEAKKLLAAAGYASGFEVTSNCITGQPAARPAKHAEVLDGITADSASSPPSTPSTTTRTTSRSTATATASTRAGPYQRSPAPRRSARTGALAAQYWSKGGATFKGFSTTGKNDKAGDPTLDAMIEKARLEGNINARKSQVNDIQKNMAKAMWGLILPGGSTGFALGWPAVRNYNVYCGGPGVWRTTRSGWTRRSRHSRGRARRWRGGTRPEGRGYPLRSHVIFPTKERPRETQPGALRTSLRRLTRCGVVQDGPS